MTTKKYELQSKRSVTVPVEIDGATYQASVDVVAIMEAAKPIVATVGRLQASAKDTGADLSSDMAELDAQVRELVRATFGAESVEAILGAEPVGIVFACAVMGVVNDITNDEEYRQAFGAATGAGAGK